MKSGGFTLIDLLINVSGRECFWDGKYCGERLEIDGLQPA